MLSDTNLKIEQLMVEQYRNKTVLEKLEMIVELNITGQQLALIGLKLRYPDASETEMKLRLAALRLDKEIMEKVFNWNIVEKGL